jgi:hypothetical protein
MVDFKKMLAERRQSFDNEYGFEDRPRPVSNIRIIQAGNDYAISFGYDRALLDAFKKAVPEFERSWHKARKVWLVTPEAIDKAKVVLEAHSQTKIILPAIPTSDPQLLGKTFLLEYLGQTKDRGGRRSAYGFVNGEWSAEFPEDVLRQFFEGYEQKQPAGAVQTLYQALCVVESVEPEQIKSAYRRLARQWHPDTCREPEAAEMFIKIKDAYQILIDPAQRKRYDAGLYFERQGQDQDTIRISRYTGYGYRAPLRCGQVTAIGTVRLMRFVIREITRWEDQVNSDGKVMVSTWPAGADTFQILWV